MDYKFLNKVVDQIVSETIIDYETGGKKREEGRGERSGGETERKGREI